MLARDHRPYEKWVGHRRERKKKKEREERTVYFNIKDGPKNIQEIFYSPYKPQTRI